MKRFVTLLGIIIFFVASPVQAKVWYVHPDSALNRIQRALDTCSTGDTVLVGPGTYHEKIFWPATQSIRLASERGPAMTVIDGDSLGQVLVIKCVVDSTTVINGFTITHGYDYYFAGGIEIQAGSPTVSGNIITGNRGSNGGGLFCWQGSRAIITGNIFTRNNAATANGGWGGGILIYQASPRVTGNTFLANRAYWYGGGILSQQGSPIITSNRIDSNSVITSNFTGGGGVSFYNDTSVFCHNSVKGNYARYGGGIRLDWYSCAIIDSNTIENNRVYGIFCGDSVFQPIIQHNNIINNFWEGMVHTDSNAYINAENNWWGDSTGPYHPDSNPGGRGDTVSDYVDFIPWSRWPIVRVEAEVCRPLGPSLVQVYPNPTKGGLSLSFALSSPSYVRIYLYDITGRKVVNLHDKIVRADEHGLNTRLPENLSSGIYFLRFETGDIKETQKILLMR